MYYYDSRVNKCYPFIYGGCGGNYNRFATEGSCLGRCRYFLGYRTLPILTPARPARPQVFTPARPQSPQIVYYPKHPKQTRPIATPKNAHRTFDLWNDLFRFG